MVESKVFNTYYVLEGLTCPFGLGKLCAPITMRKQKPKPISSNKHIKENININGWLKLKFIYAYHVK